MKRLTTFFLCIAAVTALYAQIRGNSIVVTVEPDHQDWRYNVGEKANFVVEVRQEGTLMNNVSIDYAMGPEMYQDVKKSIVLKDGTLKLT